MSLYRWRIVTSLVVGFVGGFGVLAGFTGTSESSGSIGGATLFVDRAFQIETSDPGRALEPTASIVDRAVYDTLFTYKGGDLAHPVPLLATTWSASKDARTFALQLRKDVHFADGTPLTAADVVFSFRRVINLKDSPSFLLAGITVSAPSKYVVVLRSAQPNTALPTILANTSLGIVNSKLVRRHGGTDAPNAATTDTAEQWFDSPASAGAGSGPYVLKNFTLKSPIVLAPNRRYWGTNKPAFAQVVLRNMLPDAQLVSISNGKHEVALDLTSQQAKTLQPNKRLNVRQLPSTWLFWLFANDDSRVSTITPNRHFQQAVRSALDYKAFVGLAGPGAIQAPGVIPSMILGALSQKDAIQRNLARARSELSASGVGDLGVTLEYPNDLAISGVSFTALAQNVQASLQGAGFRVSLAGENTRTFLQRYRDGKIAFGLYLWGPAVPDPSNYLVFTPGGLVGLRAGWANGSDPVIEKLAARAGVTLATNPRKKLYQQLQLNMNETGPFFPLIQPGHGFVATTDLRNAVFNPQYEIDVTQVSPR